MAPLLDYLLHHAAGSGYLRLVSVPCEVPYGLPADYQPKAGAGVELRSGADAVVFSYGPVLLPQAWLAAEELSRLHGIEIAVVNLPWLNRVDRDWLHAMVGARGAVFTLDNHLVSGGQGRMLAAAIAEIGLERPPLVRRYGPSDFPMCGQNDEVLHALGLDAKSLAKTFLQTLGKMRGAATYMANRGPVIAHGESWGKSETC